MPAPLELVLGGLDRARSRVLKACTPLSGTLAARRELRIAVIGIVGIACCFATTIAAPILMLALGPIVLGVPHLVADVRYCLVRPGWHRRRALVVAAGIPLVLAVATGELALAFVAVAGAAAAARGPTRRRMLVIALALVATIATASLPRIATLALVHAHNVVGIALWLAWRRRRTALHLLPLGLCITLTLLLLGLPLEASSWLVDEATRAQELQRLAPGLPETLATRVLLSFCFAQAVHYVIWLRLVPEDDRERVSPRTFRASYRALARELGVPLLAIAALFALALATWAVFDLHAARDGYLALAGFHVVLELAAAALIFIEGRPTDHTLTTRRGDG
ncbi:MAG TPA: hypothetical protein VG755_25595 [Nannocystaceae bacterium]|nr:hypothetical protein [Nannocystaceae bacterium]